MLEGGAVHVDAAGQQAHMRAVHMGHLGGHGDAFVQFVQPHGQQAGRAEADHVGHRHLQQRALERQVQHLDLQPRFGRGQLGRRIEGDAHEVAAFLEHAVAEGGGCELAA